MFRQAGRSSSACSRGPSRTRRPERTSRAFERWDWNSLLAIEPELRGIAAEFMDGTSDFPSRPEMEANLTAFAERAGIAVRYGCRVGIDAARGDRRRRPLHPRRRPTASTAAATRSSRSASPSRTARRRPASSSPSTTPTRATPSRTPASACSSSASRTPASSSPPGLLQWASRISLSSPSPAKTSIETRSLVGVRARYVQPFEDSIARRRRRHPRRRASKGISRARPGALRRRRSSAATTRCR